MIGLIVAVLALALLLLVSWVMLTRQRAQGDPRHDELGPDTTEDVHKGRDPS